MVYVFIVETKKIQCSNAMFFVCMSVKIENNTGTFLYLIFYWELAQYQSFKGISSDFF